MSRHVKIVLGVLAVLVGLAVCGGLGVVGAAGGFVYYTANAVIDERVLIDEETESLVRTTRTRSDVEIERTPFSEVEAVEQVQEGDEWVTRALLPDGSSVEIDRSRRENTHLRDQAAERIGVPVR